MKKKEKKAAHHRLCEGTKDSPWRKRRLIREAFDREHKPNEASRREREAKESGLNIYKDVEEW